LKSESGTVGRRVVFASGNPDKLAEVGALLTNRGLTLVPQAQFTEVAAAETGDSFAANALIKARHAALASGLPAIADDSGLEVDWLGGAPGVRSARFAGPTASDADNNALLLRRLEGVDDELRTARFRCVLVYLRGPEDAEPLICEGVWSGRILAGPRGVGGFGYDPLFLVPELGRSAAELSTAEKNLHSHRGQALRALLAALRS
jgi:XTP/dITP diphosphohydrolase